MRRRSRPMLLESLERRSLPSGSGASGDPTAKAAPPPTDYDGDGRADPAVYSPATATWYVLRTSGGPMGQPFGAPGLDVPVPADYFGQGHARLAVFRTTTAQW